MPPPDPRRSVRSRHAAASRPVSPTHCGTREATEKFTGEGEFARPAHDRHSATSDERQQHALADHHAADVLRRGAEPNLLSRRDRIQWRRVSCLFGEAFFWAKRDGERLQQTALGRHTARPSRFEQTGRKPDGTRRRLPRWRGFPASAWGVFWRPALSCAAGWTWASLPRIRRRR